MEFLVMDIASRLGFPLHGSAVTEIGGSPGSGANNPPTVAAPQLSLVSTPLPMLDHPLSQLSLNPVLYGADPHVLDHQAPIGSPLIDHQYNISHTGSDFGSGGSSTYMGYIGGEQSVSVAYPGDIPTQPQIPPPIGPSLGWRTCWRYPL